jgi:hypothetical protein
MATTKKLTPPKSSKATHSTTVVRAAGSPPIAAKLAPPGKPVARVNVDAPARTVGKLPMMPKAASETSAASLAVIEGLKAEIAKQGQMIANMKARPTNVRNKAEILEGIKLVTGDWRKPYHGEEITIFQYDRKGSAAPHDISTDVRIPVLLAIPRDSDVGGEGATYRANGALAMHYAADESGEAFTGQPLYVTADELTAVWAS